MAKDKKTIKYEADISGFKSNIQEAESKIKTLNNQLKLNQAQLKGNSNSIELLGQRVEQLKEKYKEQTTVVENTRKEYEKAVEVYGENSTEAENLKNKLIQAETKQQSISNAIKETNNQLTLQSEKFITAGAKMQSFGDRATKIGDGLNKIGSKLSIISTGIATLAGATIKASVNYESAWTGVTKTVDGTEEQMSQLREGILELSTQLPTAATEIAGVAENAGQLGIQTDNVLSFSKAMIDLGNSTNLTADEASSQLAKFANIMNMSQKDFEKLGSAIVDLGNNYATTEADIVNMAMRLAGAGHQVGMSEGQVLGLATALSSVGIEAEMGGSAISKAMVKMQNAVEQGGTKLDDVLKKTGMSLRDLELLSTNNSKDFKALADDIGMTSTELQQLIVAGTNLEDFAKVSGMTADQFKKAWKEDASGALSAFIKGLGDAESKGESAITMLSEMGLTEVRLRDSLLRAANAGDLFNNAIKTGTKAWDENVALTNEASKRYETTESKLQMLKNEIVKNGIALGDELKPALIEVLEEVKPIIANVTSLVKSFNKLDDATKKQIINMGTVAIAAGPVLKIGGKLITSVGNSAKLLGTLTKAIGVMKTGVNSGIGKVDSLAKTFVSLSNPMAAIITLTGTLTLAMIAAKAAQMQEQNSLEGLREEVENQKESWNNLAETRRASLSSSMTEISICQNLRNELSQITDENGKVKKGYEQRAEVILTTLNNALGTEYKLNGNIINQYQDLKNNIDNVITAKKAEAVLNAYQAEYETATREQTKATEALIGLKKQQTEVSKKLIAGTYEERIEAQQTLSVIGDKIKEQNDLIGMYGKTVQDYENLQRTSIEGSAEAITKAISEIGVSYDSLKETAGKSTIEQINAQQEYVNAIKSALQEAKDQHNEYQQKILESQLTANEQQLTNLENSLSKQTNTIQELTPQQIEAWKQIAERSTMEYGHLLAQVPEETRREIQNATGVVALNTSLSAQFGTTAINASNLFRDNLDTSNIAKNKILDTSTVIQNDTSVNLASSSLAQSANRGFNENADGLTLGNNLSSNIASGLSSSKSKTMISNAISTLSGWISSRLSTSMNINVASASILPGHKNGLDYVPYDNYVARLHKGERVLTAEENKRYVNENINNKLVERSIIMNFYPQSMSETEMKRTFDYVDRRLGKIY